MRSPKTTRQGCYCERSRGRVPGRSFQGHGSVRAQPMLPQTSNQPGNGVILGACSVRPLKCGIRNLTGPMTAAGYRLRVATDAKFATNTVGSFPVLPTGAAITSFPAWRAKGGQGASAAIRSGFQSTKAENALDSQLLDTPPAPPGTLQKNIIVGIGTRLNGLLRPNPHTCVADGLKRTGNHVWASPKPRTGYDLFVFRIDAAGHAKTNGAIQGQKQQVRGGAQGLKQRRNKDVRVENDANHEPSCSVVVST